MIGRRGTSIKTRIETPLSDNKIKSIIGRRGTSIKTRIETWKFLCDEAGKQVAEELPLKQGLKQSSSVISKKCFRVAEELPLKQGLKLHPLYILKILKSRRGTSIKTRIETEQGWGENSTEIVAEELPLKQGLKLILSDIKRVFSSCRRGTSIKTRIETPSQRIFHLQ